MKQAVVIGSGIAGLASSIRLALKGYQVTVFEANGYPGGKLSAFSLGEYRFDAGPSLFTMPHYVTELFESAGEDPKKFFSYKKKDIACHYFWSDKTRFQAFSARDKFLNEIENRFAEPQQKVAKYLDRAKKKYDLTQSLFLAHSLHRLQTYLSAATLKALLNLQVFELPKTLHQANSDAFTSPHLIQLFDRYATYNGSDPFQTSGIMTLIQHLEGHFGTFIPLKGMESITQSLYELAKKIGVNFIFNCKVTEILVAQSRVKGVKLGAEKYPADLVVSNMDIYPTFKKLLPKAKPPTKILNQERSSSAVIFYWGIQQSFKELELHNIFFSDDYKAEFNAIFKTHTVCEDPTIYINITSKDIPTDAPKGCENWFVMINTPADYGQDWDALVQRLKKQVLKRLSKELGTSIEPLIACEEVLTPPLIEKKTQSHLGALYGASSNQPMAAFLRHPNFSNQIKNLYFCGGSVHPGGGIPLCLLSAKIVDELIPEAR